jgi:hypothetical protein
VVLSFLLVAEGETYSYFQIRDKQFIHYSTTLTIQKNPSLISAANCESKTAPTATLPYSD